MAFARSYTPHLNLGHSGCKIPESAGTLETVDVFSEKTIEKEEETQNWWKIIFHYGIMFCTGHTMSVTQEIVFFLFSKKHLIYFYCLVLLVLKWTLMNFDHNAI